MLCVITYIWLDVLNIYNGNNRKQANDVIKTMFYDLSDDDLHNILDTFWGEYINLNDKNINFDSEEFIWSRCGIKNTIYHAPKIFVL